MLALTLWLALAVAVEGSEEVGRCAIALVDGSVRVMSPPDFALTAAYLCFHYTNPDLFRPAPANAPAPAANATAAPALAPAPANLSAQEQLEAMVRVNLTPLGHGKWEQCCRAATECCEHMLRTPPNNRTGMCRRVWDGWHCWDDAVAPLVVRGGCPNYIDAAASPAPARCYDLHSTRECGAGGRWAVKTDYATCGLSKRQAHRQMNVQLLVAYGVSIACLVPALAILFLLYRQLHGHRITLHRHLFLALLLHAVAESAFRLAVVMPVLGLGDTAKANGVGCRLLAVAAKYLRGCTYMWMLCEGFYLHWLLVAAFSSEGSITLFYVVGWGVPLLPTGAYAALRVSTPAVDRRCWMEPVEWMEWIVMTPNLISLTANTIFLARILWVLVAMMQTAPHGEPAHYRRAVRATLVLIPLFGVQFLLTVFRPGEQQCLARRLVQTADHLLDGLQGAVVACIFCFCNGEVHDLIRRAHRTFVERYQPGLRPSRGSHSFSTAQAML